MAAMINLISVVTGLTNTTKMCLSFLINSHESTDFIEKWLP